jgi:hypothetical protein
VKPLAPPILIFCQLCLPVVLSRFGQRASTIERLEKIRLAFVNLQTRELSACAVQDDNNRQSKGDSVHFDVKLSLTPCNRHSSHQLE